MLKYYNVQIKYIQISIAKWVIFNFSKKNVIENTYSCIHIINNLSPQTEIKNLI